MSPRLLRALVAMSFSYLLVVSTSWAQDCPTANTPAQVSERIEAAQAALSKMDFDQFTFSMEEVELMIPCLSARPGRTISADVHRMLGVHSYAAGKTEAAKHALYAAKVLGPQYQFPDGLFPEGYALLDTWNQLDPTTPEHRRAPVPKNSAIAFDGELTRDRPSDRSTLFQRLSKDGDVLQTMVVHPDQPLPSYESVPRQRNRIITATAAAGVVAAVSYGLAWQGRRSFDKRDTSRSRADLESLQSRVNTSFTVSGIFSTLTATGVVAAILIGPR